MKKLPRPVVLATLKGGISYFKVIITLSNQMLLSNLFVVLGRPYIKTTALFKTKFMAFKFCEIFLSSISGKWETRFDYGSLHDSGIINEGERDNLHRTYKYKPEHYNFFKEIIEKQDMERYLQVIGKNTSEKTLHKHSIAE